MVHHAINFSGQAHHSEAGFQVHGLHIIIFLILSMLLFLIMVPMIFITVDVLDDTIAENY